MKNRRLALAATIAILSTVALAPKAQAQYQAQESTIIDFSGTVQSICSFNNTLAGNLEQPFPTAEYLIANSDFSEFGRSGFVEVECRNPGMIRVSAPVKIQAPAAFNPRTAQAVILDRRSGNTATASTSGNFSNEWPWDSGYEDFIPVDPVDYDGASSYSIMMVVGNNGDMNGLPGGTYEYQVTVTVTSN